MKLNQKLFKRKFGNFIFIFIALIGLVVSSYLAYLYAQPSPIVCVTDCEIVRESKYSSFLGISIPYLGILFYSTISILFLIKLFKKLSLKIRTLIVISQELILAAGFIFSIYLTFIEIFVIEAICQWCVVSAICSTILFLFHTRETLVFLEKHKIFV